MSAHIYAGLRFEGVHHFPEARPPAAFLNQPHSHNFKVVVSVQVGHDNRDVEFIELRQWIKHALLQCYPQHDGILQLGARSCEMIGRDIMERLEQRMEMQGRTWVVEVAEDDLQGAIITNGEVIAL